MDFIAEWGKIAGIAGIGLGIFLVLFREVIRKNVFAKLTKKQSYIIIILFMILVWILSLFSIFQYNSSEEKDSVQLTVYVHGTQGKQDIVLEHTGEIVVDFGNDRRSLTIGQNGRTNLGEIPQKFLGEAIGVGLDAPGYELVKPGRLYEMAGDPIYVAVKKDGMLGKISGVVKTRDGSVFLQDAVVTVNNDTTITTNEAGIFKIELPERMWIKDDNSPYLLSVTKDEYQPKTLYYYPKSGNIEIRLNPK